MSKLLQKRLAEVNCAVLNYVKNKIEIDYFYNEIMYNQFLSGINCRQGMGLYDGNEELEFNKLNDGTLIIVQQNGVQTAKYRYVSLFKSVVEYKTSSMENKKVSFTIRKNEFGEGLNYMDNSGNSIDFDSLDAIKRYLSEKYGNYKPIDWGSFNG